jgi:hypothetical protein
MFKIITNEYKMILYFLFLEKLDEHFYREGTA